MYCRHHVLVLVQCGSGNPPTSCGEGNLDVQYIMGVAQGSSTIYYYTTASDPTSDPFTTWITTVAGMSPPPQACSISYGTLEAVGHRYPDLTSLIPHLTSPHLIRACPRPYSPPSTPRR